MIYGSVIREVLHVRGTQFLDVLTYLRLQFLVLLILVERRVCRAVGILGCKYAENGDGVAQRGECQLRYAFAVERAAASRSRTTCQHPHVAQLLVHHLQFIHILQYGQQFLLCLDDIGSHSGVILLRHEFQVLVEVLRVGLCHLQGINHPDGLLDVVVFVGCEVGAVGKCLIGRHELINRLVVLKVEGTHLLHLVSTCRQHHHRDNNHKTADKTFHHNCMSIIRVRRYKKDLSTPNYFSLRGRCRSQE